MRSTFALLLLCVSLSAGEPLQALSPPKLTAFPSVAGTPLKADNEAPLDVGKFLFVAVQNYEGEVTFDVSEGTVAFIPVKQGQQYPGIKQGTDEPAFYAAPESKCDVLMVLGRTPGKCSIAAWGVKTEKDATNRETSKAVKLATYTVVVGGKVAPDPKPFPKPEPKPEPVPFTGKGRLLVIEETADAAANRGKFFDDPALLAYLKAKCSHRPRVVDQNVIDGTTKQPPTDIAPWLKLASGKKLPQWFVVSPDGDVLLSGDMPTTPEKMLAALKGVFGE